MIHLYGASIESKQPVRYSVCSFYTSGHTLSTPYLSIFSEHNQTNVTSNRADLATWLWMLVSIAVTPDWFHQSWTLHLRPCNQHYGQSSNRDESYVSCVHTNGKSWRARHDEKGEWRKANNQAINNMDLVQAIVVLQGLMAIQCSRNHCSFLFDGETEYDRLPLQNAAKNLPADVYKWETPGRPTPEQEDLFSWYHNVHLPKIEDTIFAIQCLVDFLGIVPQAIHLPEAMNEEPILQECEYWVSNSTSPQEKMAKTEKMEKSQILVSFDWTEKNHQLSNPQVFSSCSSNRQDWAEMQRLAHSFIEFVGNQYR